MPYVALAHAGRIHYAERGERRTDRPSVVFIHGAGAGSGIWSTTLARVARVVHAVAVDLPGHGPSALGSSADVAGLSLGRYRDAVGELCGALCLGPSVLVGHSLGALVAIEAALAWPDKVRALVLVAAAPKLTVDAELKRLLRDDPSAAVAWLAEHAFSPRAKPALRRGFLAVGAVAAPEVARADFAIVEATDLTERLRDVACPITWVDGADDRIAQGVRSAAAETMPQRRGAVVTIPDAGHLLPIEAPDVIAATVKEAIA